MLQLINPALLRTQAFINGVWCNAGSGEVIQVTNPANGGIIATVPCMGASETLLAIESARVAWKPWRTLTAKKRAAILRKFHDAILNNADDLARIMTCEQGKPLQESHDEIRYAAAYIDWFAEEGKRLYGDTIPSPQGGRRIVVIKEPIGVCAAITPWNFPAAMIARKIAPALAAGCPIIVKPASQTPLSALALAYLGQTAGIPPGVFSVLTGSANAIGGELTSNPAVRKLSFTGSTEIGRILMRQTAGTIKKISMELGGNAPFIVFDDADLGAAVDGAIASKFRNAGQTCVCTNRLYVHDHVYDEFVEKLAIGIKALSVGNGLLENISQGPLIDAAAVDKVEEHIADAIANGARLVVGGKRHALGGTFFEPTLLAGATQSMKVAAEETFGPLACVFRFNTEEEVIAMANDTEFGLASYFYSRDIGRVWRVAEALEFGMVGINTGVISSEVAPFGGVKQSGLGREGSKYGIEDYIVIKQLCIGIE